MLYRKWLLRGRKAVELFELAQGLVGGINEERDVAFVHRRRQRPQPDRREQDALVAKAADEPGEPRALGPVAIGRAVVLDRARLEVQQEERSDRKSVVSGKSVSVRVDLGGLRLLTNKTLHHHTQNKPT